MVFTNTCGSWGSLAGCHNWVSCCLFCSGPLGDITYNQNNLNLIYNHTALLSQIYTCFFVAWFVGYIGLKKVESWCSLIPVVIEVFSLVVVIASALVSSVVVSMGIEPTIKTIYILSIILRLGSPS